MELFICNRRISFVKERDLTSDELILICKINRVPYNLVKKELNGRGIKVLESSIVETEKLQSKKKTSGNTKRASSTKTDNKSDSKKD